MAFDEFGDMDTITPLPQRIEDVERAVRQTQEEERRRREQRARAAQAGWQPPHQWVNETRTTEIRQPAQEDIRERLRRIDQEMRERDQRAVAQGVEATPTHWRITTTHELDPTNFGVAADIGGIAPSPKVPRGTPPVSDLTGTEADHFV